MGVKSDAEGAFLEVVCSGSPREMGLAHGQQAASLVQASVEAYKQIFVDLAGFGVSRGCKFPPPAESRSGTLSLKWPPSLSQSSATLRAISSKKWKASPKELASTSCPFSR
jgi:hypothetical protein